MMFDAWKAQFALQQGNPAYAQAWLRTRASEISGQVPFARESEALTAARILMEQGQLHRSSELVNLIHEAARLNDRAAVVIECELLRTLPHARAGNKPAAQLALLRALQLAQAEHFVRLFVDEGDPVQLLLAESYPEITDTELKKYVETLLVAFGENARAALTQPKTLAEPLSEREREILTLIAAGA